MTPLMQSEGQTVYFSEATRDSPGNTDVFVGGSVGDGDASKLTRRLHLRNHSPSGFSWGYNGSGPAQLALAILAEHYDEDTAVDHYQQFKRDVVARRDGDERFVVRGEEIERLVEEYQRE